MFDSKEPETIRGSVDRISFFDEQSRYAVFKLRVKGKGETVTVAGTFASVRPGEELAVTGRWDRHPRYGEQFRASSYEAVMPASADAMEKYLGSGLIKGIGPATAKRLVEKFGEDTLRIIDNDIEKLSVVSGIGPAKIGMIRSAWDAHKGIRDVMLFLQGHGVSPAYASKIYRHYGKDAISIVRDNPYRLAEEIFGIGFITADKIAASLGIPSDSRIRAEAGILFTLGRLSSDGHVCSPESLLVKECAELLGMSDATVSSALQGIISAQRAVKEGEFIYLHDYYDAEKGIADKIRHITNEPVETAGVDASKKLRTAQKELEIELADEQASAVSASLEHPFLVITGGPGTGKTTIIRTIINIHERLGYDIALAAPTGRAAKRMSEATGHEAKTIHRLLEFNPITGGFGKNEEAPLDADLLIIDETSMLDTLLAAALMKAVDCGTKLIFVGDSDQLPSVGAGAVLADIMASGTAPVVRLNKIFRQSETSMIIVNAHRINRGELPDLSFRGDLSQDFYFFETDDPEKACSLITDICSNRLPLKFGLHPLRDIQVLSPMHRGIAGTSNLNAELQKRLNPSTDELVRGGSKFRTADKVMQIKNNYDKDVFNGDTGTIISINREKQELLAEFDGRIVSYDFAELDELMLAYAVSVHKSQGSEYQAVVVPLLTGHYMMLQRNLLYTAVTRGKKIVVIVGSKKALAMAVGNEKTQTRHTRLRERLAGNL